MSGIVTESFIVQVESVGSDWWFSVGDTDKTPVLSLGAGKSKSRDEVIESIGWIITEHIQSKLDSEGSS